MKKIILGLSLILLALSILLQGKLGLPLLRADMWSWVPILFFTYNGLECLFKRRVIGGVLSLLLAFLIANWVYSFVKISLFALLFASLLLILGLRMIVPSWFPSWITHSTIFSKGKTIEEIDEDDHKYSIAFGTGEHFINEENFVKGSAESSFANLSIYFDHATIVGEQASFDVELAFGKMVLYIPRNWEVKTKLDNAFGNISIPENREAKNKIFYLTGDVAFGQLEVIYI